MATNKTFYIVNSKNSCIKFHHLDFDNKYYNEIENKSILCHFKNLNYIIYKLV